MGDKPDFLLTTPVKYDWKNKQFKIFPRHVLIPFLPTKSTSARRSKSSSQRTSCIKPLFPPLQPTLEGVDGGKCLTKNTAKKRVGAQRSRSVGPKTTPEYHQHRNKRTRREENKTEIYETGLQSNLSKDSPGKRRKRSPRSPRSQQKIIISKPQTTDTTKLFKDVKPYNEIFQKKLPKTHLGGKNSCHKSSTGGGSTSKLWKNKITRSFTPEIPLTLSTNKTENKFKEPRIRGTKISRIGKSFDTDTVIDTNKKLANKASLHLPDIIGKKTNLSRIFGHKHNYHYTLIPPASKIPPQFDWQWYGTPYFDYILTENSTKPHLRLCYPGIQHVQEGDIIRVKDDVLIRSFENPSDSSGVKNISLTTLKSKERKLKEDDMAANRLKISKKMKNQIPHKTTSPPYVGKIMCFWNHNGDMNMTILWYYQKEQVQILNLSSLENTFKNLPFSASFLSDRNSFRTSITQLKQDPNYESTKIEAQFPFAKYGSPKELFASRHIDSLSVGCIEDKAYVYPYDIYCRLQGQLEYMKRPRLPSRRSIVSVPRYRGASSLNKDVNLVRRNRYKGHSVSELYSKSQNIYFCSRIYDPIYKRIIKNPVFRYA